MSDVPARIVKDLAPTGELRAAINFGNSVLARGTAHAPHGVTVDLARELGRRLDVPVAFRSFDKAGKAFEAFETETLDVIFLAIDPVRTRHSRFAAIASLDCANIG